MAATLPLLTPDRIQTTFSNTGTTAVPPQTDPNGFVNFQDGYGPDYEIDLDSGNTEAKGVERPVQNYMFAQQSIMAQWWQSMGIGPWYSTMANQGIAGYNAGALVGRVSATSGEWIIWRSLVDANTIDPNTTNQTAWDYVPIDSDLATMFAMPAGGVGQKLLPGGITTEQILTSTNFNSLVTGTFEYVTDAIAAGSANTPSSYAGMVECKLWSNTISGVTTTFGVQRYLDRSGAIWVRGMRNGSWTTWATFAITSAAIIAALGYTPANAATQVIAGSGLTGGGALTGNVTLSLATLPASTVMANPSASAAVPVGCTLLNGIILNSPANTLGLGTITPANVTSSGYVNGTTGTYSGSLSAAGITSTAAISATSANISGTTSTVGVASTGDIVITEQQPQMQLVSNGASGNSWTLVSAYSGSIVPAGSLLFYNSSTGRPALVLSSSGVATINGTGTNGKTLIVNDVSSYSGINFNAGNGTTAASKTIRADGSSGSLQFVNSAYNAILATLSDGGNFTAAGTIQPGSDIRVKSKRVKIENALEIVEKYLVGHTYYRTDLKQNGAGFIAQSVKEGLPDLVGITKLGTLKDFHTVDYSGAEAYLANAITELHAIVKAQATRIAELENR